MKYYNEKSILISITCIIFHFNIYAQESKIIKEVKLQLVDEVNLSEYDIFDATGLSIDDLGNIVFLDTDRKLIGKSSIENIEDVFLFAGEIGRGPGEFQNMWTTKIDGDEILVAAIDNRKISTWGFNGQLIKEYPIRTKNVFPIRMAVCHNSEYIYLLSRHYWRKGILHVFDKEMNHVKSFSKVNEKAERSIFYHEGYLACDDSGYLIHSLMYVNKIRKYSPNGDLVLEREVYGIEENKEILEIDGRWTSLHKEAKTISGDIYYMDSRLYVAFSGIRPRRFTTIDIYSSDDITYQYSIKMPVQFRNFAINGSHIVTIDKQNRDDDVWIRVYSYEISE